MLSTDIHNYVSNEQTVHSNRKRTKIVFANGEAITVCFNLEDQNIKESLNSNIWIIRHQNGELSSIRGEEVAYLQVSR